MVHNCGYVRDYFQKITFVLLQKHETRNYFRMESRRGFDAELKNEWEERYKKNRVVLLPFDRARTEDRTKIAIKNIED